MPHYDENNDSEISNYEQILNTQIQEEPDKCRAGSISWDQVSEDLFCEAGMRPSSLSEKILKWQPVISTVCRRAWKTA